MTAIVLPDIDLDALRKAIPSLPDIGMPSMAQAGRKADETVDRLLGRSRMPVWPWLLVVAVIVAMIGSIVAVVGLNRRPPWTREDQPANSDASAGISPVESSLMSSRADDMLG